MYDCLHSNFSEYKMPDHLFDFHRNRLNNIDDVYYLKKYFEGYYTWFIQAMLDTAVKRKDANIVSKILDYYNIPEQNLSLRERLALLKLIL